MKYLSLDWFKSKINKAVDKTVEKVVTEKVEKITDERLAELQEMEDSFLKSLLEDYSIMLQNQCEYLTTDEAVEEMLTINEYQFLENGKRFN